MTRRFLILFVAALFIVLTLSAQNPSTEVGAAVDANGIRHVAKGYGQPPWFADMTRKRKPDYPYSEKSLHHEGSGFFRLTLDLKTGAVANIEIVRSTGFPRLDEAAIKTFRDWRWKPGKWKEVDVPITYTFPPAKGPQPPDDVGPNF